MTQEELYNQAQAHYTEVVAPSLGTTPLSPADVRQGYQAGFRKALELVSEAMNQGKDLIEEFEEVM